MQQVFRRYHRSPNYWIKKILMKLPYCVYLLLQINSTTRRVVCVVILFQDYWLPFYFTPVIIIITNILALHKISTWYVRTYYNCTNKTVKKETKNLVFTLARSELKRVCRVRLTHSVRLLRFHAAQFSHSFLYVYRYVYVYTVRCYTVEKELNFYFDWRDVTLSEATDTKNAQWEAWNLKHQHST